MKDEMEKAIKNYFQQVWEQGWFLRAYGYCCIVWRCDSRPCSPDCQWGVGLGEWYISQIYKLGTDTYLPYSPSAQ